MHQKFLQQAIALAANNVTTGAGGPYGAVIVKNGEVIATGANQVTTQLDPTAHAEIMAIRAACIALGDFQLNDCVLYTSCEPCPMCLGAIYWARLAEVYYACSCATAAAAGFDDCFIYGQFEAAPDKRRIKIQHVNVCEAALPFELWAAKADKVSY